MSTVADSLREALADRYELLEELGRGGMAVVYRARDMRHEREVAIKVLRPELAEAVGRDRFLREIRIASKLQHPNILPLHDSGDADGILFYVMPFVEGESLRDRLGRDEQLPVEDALRITREVGDALFYAHTQGLVHRDIKPENILISFGHAMVADFGIAHAISEAGGERITESGIAIGTPAYMSPEQAGGDSSVDGRSDVYSLGCVLYEMLVGEPPFGGRTAQAVIARHMQERVPSIEVVRPNVSPAIVEVVERALAKVPADRFATAEEFVAALTASETGPTHRPDLGAKGRWWLRASGAAALVLAAVAVWLLGIRPEPPALDPNKIVVFPLLNRGSPPIEPGTGADMAIMIGQALEHTEPLKWIDAWTRLGDREREDIGLLTAAAATEITRQRGARYYLDGAVLGGSDSATVVLRLHDAEGDSLVVQESASAGVAEGPLYLLGLAAVRSVLPVLLDPEREFDLSVLSDRDPGAVALHIQGEREYRSSDFGTALDFYQRAVQQDSALAFAAMKGAQAASWRGEFPEAEALISVALEHDTLIPVRYAHFGRGLRAYLTGDADEAVAELDRAIEMDEDWSEAHMALGEVFYHLIPSLPGRLVSAALEAFESAAALDSGFTPPLVHLSEIAVRAGDAEGASAIIDRLELLRADSALVRYLRIMVDCVEDGGPVVGWDVAAGLRPRAVFRAAIGLTAGGARMDCAGEAFRALLDPRQVPEGYHWGSFLGLHGVLAAQRRAADVVALVDSVRDAGTGMAMALYVLDVAAGLPVEEQAARVVEILRTAFGEGYERVRDPGTVWLLAVWHAHRGELGALLGLRRHLQTLGNTTSDPDLRRVDTALAAHVALLQGDSATAVDLLRAVTPTGRRDQLEWDLWEAHPVERLLLARLLLARGEPAAAHDVAAGFDHPAPITYLPFLPASLELRINAARAMRRPDLVMDYERRLAGLNASRGT